MTEVGAGLARSSMYGTTASARIGVALRRRLVPLAMIGALVLVSLLYSLLWGPVVAHHSYWVVPGDLWGTFRTAQFVSWGDIGDLYNTGGGLVSLPGISVVLAPAALPIDHLGLSIGFPIGIQHPSAWFVLGPYEVGLGALVLVPLDSLAERLGLGRGARNLSTFAEAAVLFPVLAIWGHPEDSIALALAIWGLEAAFDDHWRRAGWLLGLALATQPLVVLIVPIVVGLAPSREWPKLALRGVLPSALLVAIPLAESWRQTTTALLKQPNYPRIDHATPWLVFAPVLSRTRSIVVPHFGQLKLAGGTERFTTSLVHTVAGEVVAAGPGRLISIALACGLGVYVWRRRPGQEQLVWLCCVALGLRCVFEAVMDPYYLWPPLALAFVLVVRRWPRFAVACAASAALTWWSYRHIGPWEWWLPVVILLGVVVAAAWPATKRPESQSETLVDGSARRPVGAGV